MGYCGRHFNKIIYRCPRIHLPDHSSIATPANSRWGYVLFYSWKSSDLDPTPTNLVKYCIDILITPMTSIINLLLTEGSFPLPFKSALVSPLLNNHHHHYVPSVVNRSAVMDLHRSRSCATLIQSLYDIFVHSLMLSVHIVLGLPRPLLLFILPSISNRCIPSPLNICPKYWHFLFLIVFNNDLLVFILCKTSALVLCSFHDILNILLYSHISKASNLSDVTLVSVHVSAPYKSVDQI